MRCDDVMTNHNRSRQIATHDRRGAVRAALAAAHRSSLRPSLPTFLTYICLIATLIVPEPQGARNKPTSQLHKLNVWHCGVKPGINWSRCLWKKQDKRENLSGRFVSNQRAAELVSQTDGLVQCSGVNRGKLQQKLSAGTITSALRKR